MDDGGRIKWWRWEWFNWWGENERSEGDDSDDQLSDVNSIELIYPLNSDEDSNCKEKKRNFSSLNIKGISLKVAEGGTLCLERPSICRCEWV